MFGCRGCFRTVAGELLPHGRNPELINYLQGTWVLTSNQQSTLQIKRDSIIQFVNDSVKNFKNLAYLFSGNADDYFTKDNTFDFWSDSGRTLSSHEFKLIENGNGSDTITHFLAYVSKTKLIISTYGKFEEYNRVR